MAEEVTATLEELAADLALCGAATGGKWLALTGANEVRSDLDESTYFVCSFEDQYETNPNGPADCAFIAAARTRWPATIRLAQSLADELECFRATLADNEAFCAGVMGRAARAEGEVARLRKALLEKEVQGG